MGMTGMTISVENVCQILRQLAPLPTAEPWDNVGLLLGRSERTVIRLMTCLTLTPAVAREAITSRVIGVELVRLNSVRGMNRGSEPTDWIVTVRVGTFGVRGT